MGCFKNETGASSEYKKCCYWVDFQTLESVREHLQKEEVEVPEETRIPCRVLRASMDLAVVAPSAWNGFCKRRTSWYWKSHKARQSLIVSHSPLDVPDIGHAIVITDSNFKPHRLPSAQEISQLIESQEYQKRKPVEWAQPDLSEKDFYQRWFERQREKEPFDFDKILLSHSANHANFIDPKFFNDLNGGKVPYSIADSTRVCSSCLEFFNILGSQWPVKYVIPCIGAVQFAKLPIDHYLKVITSGER